MDPSSVGRKGGQVIIDGGRSQPLVLEALLPGSYIAAYTGGEALVTVGLIEEHLKALKV
jgi:hypothetical protein